MYVLIELNGHFSISTVKVLKAVRPNNVSPGDTQKEYLIRKCYGLLAHLGINMSTVQFVYLYSLNRDHFKVKG